ncbi:MAG: hypothetical protein FWC13_07460, partial [Oscillospiraceae bacterium]|nr:hypothetical protein [Oscillospiraceae bacterium]
SILLTLNTAFFSAALDYTLFVLPCIDASSFYAYIEYAQKVTERQLTDRENSVEGAFGCFYAFEDDNETFELEWNQNHRFHMGNIEPVNLVGFIDLLSLCPNHEDAPMWHNTLKTYTQYYAKKTANLSPLGIYPLTMYKDKKHGGVKFFKITNHGATALYGQIAKNFAELANYFSDPELIQLAENNLQFVAGLNPGIPESYDEKKWLPKSLIVGLGADYFYVQHNLKPAPQGSGINGFSSDVQFVPKRLGDTIDSPKGILNEENEFQFNEDYLPHSHGYVSGVAFLERDNKLIISTKNHGKPIVSNVDIAVDGQKSSYKCDGQICIENLTLLSHVEICAAFENETIRQSLTVTGDSDIEIDFLRTVYLSLNLPEELQNKKTEAHLTIENPTGHNLNVSPELSAYGVNMSETTGPAEILAKSSMKYPFMITPAHKSGTYTVKAKVSIGEKSYTIYETAPV